MPSLAQLSGDRDSWLIDDFVQVVNTLLPRVLYGQPAGKRGQDPVTHRLVRFYVNQGFVDRGQRVGRERHYGYRQLLQLLFLRRMIFEGHGLRAMGRMTAKSNEELEGFLEAGANPITDPASPAPDRLTERHYKPALPDGQDLGFSFFARSALDPSPSAPEHWTRLVVVPGLELHFKSDFVLSGTEREREDLVKHLTAALKHAGAKPRTGKH